MSTKNEIYKLIAVIVFIILIIGGFILYLSLPLFSQESLILATTPVDPFDPIRGQFMIINYEINIIPAIEGANIGDKIYVLLEEDNNRIARHISSQKSKPKEGIFIKGKIKSVSNDNMQIEYGIEQYFFERGGRFESQIRNVEIKISGFGTSRIVNLLDENKEIIIFNPKNKSLTS